MSVPLLLGAYVLGFLLTLLLNVVAVRTTRTRLDPESYLVAVACLGTAAAWPVWLLVVVVSIFIEL